MSENSRESRKAAELLEERLRGLEAEIGSLNKEVERLRTENRRWAKMAGTDALTGLPNKISFVRALLPQMVERAAREEQPLGLVLLSADDLGEINQKHGRGIGQLLRSVLPEGDRLAHLDGAHFGVVIYPGHLEAAKGRANMLRARVRAHSFPCGEETAQITVSAGVLAADVPSAEETRSVTDTLLGLLNRALYIAKKAGGNRVETAPNNPYESRETVS